MLCSDTAAEGGQTDMSTLGMLAYWQASFAIYIKDASHSYMYARMHQCLHVLALNATLIASPRSWRTKHRVRAHACGHGRGKARLFEILQPVLEGTEEDKPAYVDRVDCDGYTSLQGVL